MPTGIIFKAVSQFYYIANGDIVVECTARGRFRHTEESPLVGDRVLYDVDDNSKGFITELLQRKNTFARPPVCNIDIMVIVISAVIPVTDPFLADRMAAAAALAGCESLVCVNKCDENRGDELFSCYASSGFKTIRTSADSGEGLDELYDAMRGKICAFTGNSGVGKSSILNILDTKIGAAVGDVSYRLGRGRHTTRHVEMFTLKDNTFAIDTPGFSSFDVEALKNSDKSEIQYLFPDFASFLGNCKYSDCIHIKEPGCAVRAALDGGEIQDSRYRSYTKLLGEAELRKSREYK